MPEDGMMIHNSQSRTRLEFGPAASAISGQEAHSKGWDEFGLALWDAKHLCSLFA